MDTWFRPVFSRRQTPKPTDHNKLSATDKREGTSKSRATGRVSSRIGFLLGSPPSAARTSAPEPIIKSPTSPNITIKDVVYHKPSPDQIAETLKVVIMNQNTMDPVPVEHNSSILHVLEAYHDMRLQIIEKDAEIATLKRNQARDFEDFEEMAMGWVVKENDYQKEVKRLEVLLANTEGGMESVVMARSRSSVHGAKRALDTIGSGIGTIKQRHAPEKGRGQVVAKDEIADEASSPIFATPDNKDRAAAALLRNLTPTINKPRRSIFNPQHSHPRAQSSKDAPKDKLKGVPNETPKGVSKDTAKGVPKDTPKGVSKDIAKAVSKETPNAVSKEAYKAVSKDTPKDVPKAVSKDAPKDAPKKQNPEGWSVAAFAKAQLGGLGLRRRGRRESRASSMKAPSLMSMKEEEEEEEDDIAPNNAIQDGRMSLREKPLPSIPGKSRSLTEHDPDVGSLAAYFAAPREMGFSFRPGDDANILSPIVAADEAKRFPRGHALRQASSNEAAWRSRAVLSSPADGSENRPKVPPKSKAKPKASKKKSHIPESFRDYTSLSRKDSSSDNSVITAVRENSGRNSLDGNEKDKQVGSPKPERAVGDDAVGDAKARADSSNQALLNRQGVAW